VHTDQAVKQQFCSNLKYYNTVAPALMRGLCSDKPSEVENTWNIPNLQNMIARNTVQALHCFPS
jgi:hypothetical protein